MSFPSNKGLAQIEEEFAIEEADELSNLLSLSLPMIFETLDNRWKGLTGWKSDEGSEGGRRREEGWGAIGGEEGKGNCQEDPWGTEFEGIKGILDFF